jgi:hypothetical protein
MLKIHLFGCKYAFKIYLKDAGAGRRERAERLQVNDRHDEEEGRYA